MALLLYLRWNARPGAAPIGVELGLDATVGELRKHLPSEALGAVLSFAGERLTDDAAQLADVGVGNEGMVEVDPRPPPFFGPPPVPQEGEPHASVTSRGSVPAEATVVHEKAMKGMEIELGRVRRAIREGRMDIPTVNLISERAIEVGDDFYISTVEGEGWQYAGVGTPEASSILDLVKPWPGAPHHAKYVAATGCFSGVIPGVYFPYKKGLPQLSHLRGVWLRLVCKEDPERGVVVEWTAPKGDELVKTTFEISHFGSDARWMLGMP
eukprot:Hpha_TRINITY_DN28140_c0_g1::TRINITY_DN28140_c0_g1_i1::g.103282::m.103282